MALLNPSPLLLAGAILAPTLVLATGCNGREARTPLLVDTAPSRPPACETEGCTKTSTKTAAERISAHLWLDRTSFHSSRHLLSLVITDRIDQEVRTETIPLLAREDGTVVVVERFGAAGDVVGTWAPEEKHSLFGQPSFTIQIEHRFHAEADPYAFNGIFRLTRTQELYGKLFVRNPTELWSERLIYDRIEFSAPTGEPLLTRSAFDLPVPAADLSEGDGLSETFLVSFPIDRSSEVNLAVPVRVGNSRFLDFRNTRLEHQSGGYFFSGTFDYRTVTKPNQILRGYWEVRNIP